jgi:hypothetical protein
VSRFAGADARRYTALALLTAVLVSACSQPDRQFDVVATDSIVISKETADDTSDTRIERVMQTEDPFFIFGFSTSTDAAATNSLTLVWLLNASQESVVVEAEAGAGRVVVDTVAPSDSVQVTIDTRADSVRFIAETLGGAALGQIALPMGFGPQTAAFPR